MREPTITRRETERDVEFRITIPNSWIESLPANLSIESQIVACIITMLVKECTK